MRGIWATVMKWMKRGTDEQKAQQREDQRDPEVAQHVKKSNEILERHRVLLKELAALERELANRR